MPAAVTRALRLRSADELVNKSPPRLVGVWQAVRMAAREFFDVHGKPAAIG